MDMEKQVKNNLSENGAADNQDGFHAETSAAEKRSAVGTVTEGVPNDADGGTREEEKIEVPVKKSEMKRLFIIIGIVAALAVFVGSVFTSNSTERKLQEQLNLGAKYIDELQYEQALACYKSVVEIDPKSVDAYLGIVETYIRMGEYDLALEWAEKGYELTGDDQLAEKTEMIKSGNIRRWDGQTVKMTQFDANGNVTWWHEYTYDRENREDSVSHYNADGNLVKTLPCTYDEAGNVSEGYRWNSNTGEVKRSVYSYEEGIRVSEVEFGSDDTTIEGWVIYENNEEGKVMRYITGSGSHIGEKTEITGYYECVYDENGELVKRSVYDSNYKLLMYHIWERDGRNKKDAEYDADGNLRWYETREYNEEGKVKSMKRFNGNGKLEYENTYE